ncbi:MAG: HAD hydrolase-like protein [Verrucomicrobiales bacterium]
MSPWSFSLDIPPGDFAGYIFDCDGTLIDSMPLHWHAWRVALAEQTAPFDFTEAMHHAFAGQSIPETVAICNERFGCQIDPDRVERDRTEYFFSHLDQLRLVDPAGRRALSGRCP